MSVITEFTIPADAFALDATFETVPDVAIEIERLATHSRKWIMPFLWATSSDIEAVETALHDDPSTDEVRTLDIDGDIGYFTVHWSEEIQELVDEIVDRHGIMQEAEAIDGTWYFKFQFVDRNALEDFQTSFHERGNSFELERLYDGTAPKEREFDLTTEQREALVTALKLGYFSIPREAQIDELAAELGISANAVSERLRRATANLTRNTLTVSPPKGTAETE